MNFRVSNFCKCRSQAKFSFGGHFQAVYFVVDNFALPEDSYLNALPFLYSPNLNVFSILLR